MKSCCSLDPLKHIENLHDISCLCRILLQYQSLHIILSVSSKRGWERNQQFKARASRALIVANRLRLGTSCDVQQRFRGLKSFSCDWRGVSAAASPRPKGGRHVISTLFIPVSASILHKLMRFHLFSLTYNS